MPYIGHGVTNAGTFYILDDLTMSSSTTYTMQVGGVSVTPKADNLLITLDGVVQHTPDAYTVSGSTITFASAPGSGVDFYGIIMGQSASIGQGSIGADELKVTGDGSSGQVLASDGDGTFTWTTDTENYLPLAGGTMSGAINLGSQNVTNGGTITGTFVGNITGNVTGNVSGTAPAGTLTGSTLASGVTASSLTSVGTLTTLTVDDITLNSSTISDSGDLTLDVGGDIVLDADGGDIIFKDGGTGIGQFWNANSGDFYIGSLVSDKDIYIRGNDGGTGVNALSFDMSEGGNATFAGNVELANRVRVMNGATASGGLYTEQTITGGGSSSDLCLFTEQNELHFMTGGSSTKRATMDNDGNLTMATGNIYLAAANNPALIIDTQEVGADTFKIYVGGTGLSFYNLTDSKGFWFKHDGDMQFGADGATVNTKTWGNAEVTGSIQGSDGLYIAQDSGYIARYNQAGYDTYMYHDNTSMYIRNNTTIREQRFYTDQDSLGNGVKIGNGANSWSSIASDERLKDNWTMFDDALGKINTLTKIGTYNRIDPDTKETVIFEDEEETVPKVFVGVSAQEIKEILPEAVSKSDEEEYYGLNYQDVFCLMLKSIQELSAKVTALENA